MTLCISIIVDLAVLDEFNIINYTIQIPPYYYLAH